ncbi:MAG: T9SS type A sorting domain-containing protein [Bacteroidia bacterium]|nr:T9SS type A sorting domain-containing protein [Bacteroidia bacterium]
MRILFISILFAVLLVKPGFSQISQGGKPPSFEFKSINEVIDTRIYPQPDMDQIRKEDAVSEKNGTIYKIGRIIPVKLNMENSGTWTSLPDGSNIWRLKIGSPGAKAISVYYDHFQLPAKGKLFLYNEDKTQVLGAYTQIDNYVSGEFATELVQGETVTLEYSVPCGVNDQAEISIRGFSYTYRGVSFYRNTNDFGQSASCEVNINCAPEGTNWQHQKRGVARILIVASTFTGWCSGSLVNNVRQDCTEYFLTADHCYEESNVQIPQSYLNQWIFYFNYEAPGCSNPNSQGTLATHTITGCTKKANGGSGGDTGSDFFLTTLNQTIPASWNVYYIGWSRNTTASPSGVGIHHPYGDIKKISTYTNTLTSTYWSNASYPNTHWEVTWSTTTNGHGVTEGGSSGSPIFDNHGYLIGTLTGGGSACTVNGAGTGTGPTMPDEYGKFSYHWISNGSTNATQVKPWLDPDNLGLMSLNGKESTCTTNPPVADFTVDNDTIFAGGSVNFTDLSQYDPNHWKWYFGGAVVDSSSQQNPWTVTYSAAGSYNITLIAVNNYGTDTIIKQNYIIVLPAPPDLVVQNPQVNPAAIDAGTNLVASCIIKNSGSNPSIGCNVNFYLSSNSVYNAGTDQLLGTVTIGGLGVNSTVQISDTLTIPLGTPGGNQYIIFYTDADHQVLESNENNNTNFKVFSINSYYPDLLVQNAGVDSLTIRRGSTTNASCDVHNSGNATSVASTLKFYLSQNTTYEASDTYLNEIAVDVINPALFQTLSQSITIPTAIANGTWYVLFQADANNVMVESNENNNIGYKPINVISPLGLGQLDKKLHLRILPNPTSGVLKIYFDNNSGEAGIIIRNILGQEVYCLEHITGASVSENIDLSKQPTGIYMLEMHNQSGTETRKIIKE